VRKPRIGDRAAFDRGDTVVFRWLQALARPGVRGEATVHVGEDQDGAGAERAEKLCEE